MTGPLIHPGLAKGGSGWAVATRRFDDFDVAPATADIQAMRSEWKAGLGEMKADPHARRARLIKRIAGLVVAGAAAAAGVAIAVNQVLGPEVGG